MLVVAWWSTAHTFTFSLVQVVCFKSASTRGIVCVMGVDSLSSQRWAVISKTQMKNTKKAFNREQMKNDAKDKKEVCFTV